MAKNNKGKQPERTPQEDEQIQDILAQYNQIARNLKKSRNEDQIGDALSAIFELPETAQIGLLKALAKEHTTPAADIVLAVNTYAPIKEVRKEARRSLIQLEGSNVYPEWTMPSVMSLSDIVGIDPFEGLDDDDYDEDDDTMGETVIAHFIRHWSQRDFALAYDLLATDSPIKEGLTSEDWVAKREAWAAEAEPSSVKIDVGYSLNVDEDVPDDIEDRVEELDAFWSLEMEDVPGATSIPELPIATITLPATGRHWFWASYTFLLEDDELRILNTKDRGAEALQLSSEEVEARIQEIADEVHAMSEALTEDEDDENDEDEVEDESDLDEEDEVEDVEDESDLDEDEDDDEELDLDLDEVRWFTKQSLHYCDSLIAHTPEDDATYVLAAQQASIIEEVERAAAYLTIAAERLPDERGDILRSLGTTYTELAAEDTISHEELEEELAEDE